MGGRAALSAPLCRRKTHLGWDNRDFRDERDRDDREKRDNREGMTHFRARRCADEKRIWAGITGILGMREIGMRGR